MSITAPGACRRPRSSSRPGGGVMQQAGGLEPGVEAGQLSAGGGRQQGPVGNALQMLGNRPEIVLRGHPVKPVEAGQVDGAAVATEGALPGQVVVVLEIRHGEL